MFTRLIHNKNIKQIKFKKALINFDNTEIVKELKELKENRRSLEFIYFNVFILSDYFFKLIRRKIP